MGKFLHAAGDWSLGAIRSVRHLFVLGCVIPALDNLPSKNLRGMKGSTWMTCSMGMELQCMSRPWELLRAVGHNFQRAVG